jgi:hypothetical protein
MKPRDLEWGMAIGGHQHRQAWASAGMGTGGHWAVDFD